MSQVTNHLISQVHVSQVTNWLTLEGEAHRLVVDFEKNSIANLIICAVNR